MSEYDVLINKYDALNAGYDQLYPKPMKHANTHANGGTDPITPGDIGAYSKSETYSKTEADTLLQNKAPAGYGLGSYARWLNENTDLNDQINTGWYYWFSKPSNAPITYGAMNVIYTVDGVVQEVTRVAPQDGTIYNTDTNCKIRRIMYDNVWYPWEWVNPPMELGKEYRTTERHLGKPVYKKRFTTNALPNNAQLIQENVINASTDSLFDLHITFVDTADGSVSSYPPFYGTNIAARAWVRGTGELVITTFTDLSSSKAIVTLKYTKTTD